MLHKLVGSEPQKVAWKQTVHRTSIITTPYLWQHIQSFTMDKFARIHTLSGSTEGVEYSVTWQAIETTGLVSWIEYGEGLYLSRLIRTGLMRSQLLQYWGGGGVSNDMLPYSMQYILETLSVYLFSHTEYNVAATYVIVQALLLTPKHNTMKYQKLVRYLVAKTWTINFAKDTKSLNIINWQATSIRTILLLKSEPPKSIISQTAKISTHQYILVLHSSQSVKSSKFWGNEMVL